GVCLPAGPTPPAVTTLTLSPTSVTGGASSTGTVTLNMPAPAGGVSVSLSSLGAGASVPLTVVVPAGQTQATFTVTTFAVNVSTVATISALIVQGGQASALLTVNPGVAACTPTTCAAQGKNCGTIADGCGGTLTCGTCTAPQTCGGSGVANVCALATASLTLTATGRAGESISSSPAGLTVNVGATGSASFTTGTSITL